MEELSEDSKINLIKKMDRTAFQLIDKFKASNMYSNVIDFYSAQEEEKQKLIKAILLSLIITIPLFLAIGLWLANYKLKDDLETRINLIQKANAVIEQKQGLLGVGKKYLSSTQINRFSELKNTISSVLSTIGFDLAKIQVEEDSDDSSLINNEQNNDENDDSLKNNESASLALDTNQIKSVTANVKFTNISTHELMNMFINLIQREKFQVHYVSIVRNNSTNLLSGKFKVVHLSTAQSEDLTNGF